jgi:hypothetical protein
MLNVAYYATCVQQYCPHTAADTVSHKSDSSLYEDVQQRSDVDGACIGDNVFTTIYCLS